MNFLLAEMMKRIQFSCRIDVELTCKSSPYLTVSMVMHAGWIKIIQSQYRKVKDVTDMVKQVLVVSDDCL